MTVMRPRAVLIGPPGAGKSTIAGKLMAAFRCTQIILYPRA